MARKGREHPAEAPPPAASSSDDEEEDDDSSDDEQQQQQQQQQSSSSTEEEDEDDENAEEENSPSPPHPKDSTQKKQPGSPKPAEPDSGSDSDSDSDSALPPPKKPTTTDAKKSKPKPAAPGTVTVLASPAPVAKAKRKAPEKNDKGTPKKAKKEKVEVSGTSQDEGKKPLFQRLWSEGDEIAILQGIIEYKAKKGTDPMADADGFIEFVKKSLHVDVSRSQVISKVRALKRKFETAKKKKKINDPHGVKMFELSKRIWETDEIKNNGVVDGKDSKLRFQNVKKKAGSVEKLMGGKNEPVSEVEKEEKLQNGMISRGEKELNLEDLVNFGSMKNGFLREGVKLLGEDEKAKLDEKWRKQSMTEMEIYLKRLDLIRELTQKALNAIKSA